MDNYNLFSDFGFNNDMDFFQVTGTEKKKAAKKESAKEKPKKKDADYKNTAQDVEIALPIKVVARNCCITFGESGKKKMSQVADELIEMGFVELTIKGIGLELSQGAENVLYIVENNVKAQSPSILVFEDEEQTVTVADGEIRAQFSVNDFDEEIDNITCQKLADKWSEINTSYKGCRLAKEEDVYYPVLEERADSKETSVAVTFAGCTVRIDKSKGSNLKDAMKEACKEYWPEDMDIKICGANDSYFFVTYQGKQGKKAAYYKNGMDKAASKKEKKEVTYDLPFTLRVPNWNMDYEMTLDMFPGKQSVTKEEVKTKMASIAPMFGDQSRKIDFCFFPEHNLMSAMFYSGSKGAVAVSAMETDFYEKAHIGSVKLIRTMEELACVKKSNHFIGVMNEDSPFKILALPHGNFYGYFGKELECCTVKRVVFERKLPLIPKRILEEVVSSFRKDLSKEACVRILYQKNTGEFLVVEAKGERTKTNISYDFSDVAPLMMQPEMICVMEIHSHNTMRAFFSSVDDEDEQYPGIFGVIGCLDKEPQMLFRARLDGVSSKPIPVEELFES